MSRVVRVGGLMLPACGRAAGVAAAAIRRYTRASAEREAERAEFASGLLSKVGVARLPGAGFEVRHCPPIAAGPRSALRLISLQNVCLAASRGSGLAGARREQQPSELGLRQRRAHGRR